LRSVGAITLNSSNTAQALVLETDILCANGVIHKIDKFLLPVWYDRVLFKLALLLATQWGDISIGIQLIFQAMQGGLSVFGDELTSFFPLDSAFQELEPEILAFYMDPVNTAALIKLLQGHLVETVYPSVGATDGDVLTTVSGTQIVVSVLPDNTVMFNDAALDPRSDVLASNGIAHGITKVFLPPTTMPTTSSSPTQAPSSSPTHIIDSPSEQKIESANASGSEQMLTKGSTVGIAFGAFLIVLFMLVFATRRWASKTRKDDPFATAIQAHAVPAEEMVAPSVPPGCGVSVTLTPDIIEVLPPSGTEPSGQARSTMETRNYEVVDLDTLEVVNTSSVPTAGKVLLGGENPHAIRSGNELPEYKDQVRGPT